MNPEKFVVELKELRCVSDWHRRYYAEQARRYNRIDYWVRSLLGVAALIGAVMSGIPESRILGAILAGGCAFIMANILPIFKWEARVSGFNEAENEWMRIFKGYEDVLSFYEISDRGEILVQEFQRVKEMQKAAAFSDKRLPVNERLLRQKEQETRDYYSAAEPAKSV